MLLSRRRAKGIYTLNKRLYLLMMLYDPNAPKHFEENPHDYQEPSLNHNALDENMEI